MKSPFLRSVDGETWFEEEEFQGTSTRLKVKRLIHHGAGLQDVLVFENTAFGRVLALDGVIQVTSKDEFIYHEMMVHAVLLAHGSAARVLIIGGGDGGILREVLRHRTVESVTLVEIDGSVVETCRRFMPDMSAGAFDDPRLDLRIEDGAVFAEQADANAYDVVIVDSSDPEGPAEVLFTAAFYAECRRILSKDGVMISQNGVPFLQADAVRSAFVNLREAFGDDGVNAVHVTVPSYTGGPMLLGLATRGQAPTADPETLNERFSTLGFVPKHFTPGQYLAGLSLSPEHRAIVFAGSGNT